MARSRFSDASMGVPDIGTYEQALEHFERVAPRRGRDPDVRPAGQAHLTNRIMTRLADGSIRFTYFNDPIVTYHPDGTVSAQACTKQRNGDMPVRVLPIGIREEIGTRAGPIILTIPLADRQASPHGYYGGIRIKDESNRQILNPRVRVMRASRPIHLRLDRKTDRWEPLDEGKLEPFQWQELDKKAALAVSRDSGFADFNTALKAYMGLDATLPEREDIPAAAMLAAIKARDFTTVLAGLDREPYFAPNAQGIWTKVGERPKKSAIDRLRVHAYKEAGVLVERSERVLTLAGYRAVEALMKRLG